MFRAQRGAPQSLPAICRPPRPASLGDITPTRAAPIRAAASELGGVSQLQEDPRPRSNSSCGSSDGSSSSSCDSIDRAGECAALLTPDISMIAGNDSGSDCTDPAILLFRDTQEVLNELKDTLERVCNVLFEGVPLRPFDEDTKLMKAKIQEQRQVATESHIHDQLVFANAVGSSPTSKQLECAQTIKARFDIMCALADSVLEKLGGGTACQDYDPSISSADSFRAGNESDTLAIADFEQLKIDECWSVCDEAGDDADEDNGDDDGDDRDECACESEGAGQDRLMLWIFNWLFIRTLSGSCIVNDGLDAEEAARKVLCGVGELIEVIAATLSLVYQDAIDGRDVLLSKREARCREDLIHTQLQKVMTMIEKCAAAIKKVPLSSKKIELCFSYYTAENNVVKLRELSYPLLQVIAKRDASKSTTTKLIQRCREKMKAAAAAGVICGEAALAEFAKSPLARFTPVELIKRARAASTRPTASERGIRAEPQGAQSVHSSHNSDVDGVASAFHELEMLDQKLQMALIFDLPPAAVREVQHEVNGISHALDNFPLSARTAREKFVASCDYLLARLRDAAQVRGSGRNVWL